MKKGLDHDVIISEAVKMIETVGYDSFSLRELAKRLGVKPSSLYNHLDGIEEINTAVAMKAAEGMENALAEAMKDKSPEDAFVDGALAYKAFAENNPELYKALISMPTFDDERVRTAGFRSFAPLRELTHRYISDKNDAINFNRALRSVIHGFIELGNNGFMTRGGVSKDETYLMIVREYLRVLKKYPDKCKEKITNEKGNEDR